MSYIPYVMMQNYHYKMLCQFKPRRYCFPLENKFTIGGVLTVEINPANGTSFWEGPMTIKLRLYESFLLQTFS